MRRKLEKLTDETTVSSVLRHGVPKPFPREAPSSWMCRLALAQGCLLEELMQFLQLGSVDSRDLDLEILGVRLPELAKKCCLYPSAFAYGAFAMAQFGEVDLKSPPLLTWRKKARFRYCPSCLAKANPHFDVRWRFSEWRHCLAHSCLLEDRCQNCGAFIVYPSDMTLSEAGRAGHASQRRCQNCSADLASAQSVFVNLLRPGVVTQQAFYQRLKSWPSTTPSSATDRREASRPVCVSS